MQGIDLQIVSVIVGIFLGLGTLIAGCGFAYAQFKSGGDKAKDDLIETLKETAVVEREKASRLATEKTMLVDSHQVQINDLSSKMGKLQGSYEASENSKKEYLEILQGRDPGQKAFMELILAQIKKGDQQALAIQNWMEDMTAISSQIRIFMENLSKKADENLNPKNDIGGTTSHETNNVLVK